jgi:hypothetical protein
LGRELFLMNFEMHGQGENGCSHVGLARATMIGRSGEGDDVASLNCVPSTIKASVVVVDAMLYL